MTSLRIQNIPEAKMKRLRAIARVKYGLELRDYIKMLIAQDESRYDLVEMQRIESLYEAIKNED